MIALSLIGPGLAAMWSLWSLWRLRGAMWAAVAASSWALRLGALALLAVSMAARLVWLNAAALHECDGHEAEYCSIFLGEQGLSAGSTTLYPLMQVFWWAAGLVLPADPRWTVWISVVISTAAVGLVALALGRLAGPRAGLAAGLLVALHPSHAAWGTSAYNINVPNMLFMLSLCAAATLSRTNQQETRAPLAGLGAAAFALAVAGRMELALAGLMPLGLLLLRPARGQARPMNRQVGIATLAGLGLAALAILPLLGGALPGEGERALALRVNLGLAAPYAPFDDAPGMALIAAAGLAALVARPWLTLCLGAAALVNHLGLSTFDDMGARHTLVALPALVWALVGSWRGRLWPLSLAFVLAGLGLELRGQQDLRGRYYASESSFAERLTSAPWRGLPHKQLKDPAATGVSPIDPRCAWIAEDPRVASEPFYSHFNLLDPDEAERLGGETGCVHWCYGPEDSRWSSRGVSDRALRLARLYALSPVAVVEVPDSGYACVVLSVGQRRCCAPDRGWLPMSRDLLPLP